MFCEHRMHVEMRRHSLQCLTCLQQHLLLTAHSRLASLCTPGNSPVSTSHLVTGTVGLWTSATMTGFMWLLDTQTQVHTYAMLSFPTDLYGPQTQNCDNLCFSLLLMERRITKSCEVYTPQVVGYSEFLKDPILTE